MKEFIDKLLNSNDWQYRMLRTILQGIIGVLIANVDYIVGAHFDGTTKTIIVALCMAILSPIMAQLKGSQTEEAE